MTTTFHDGAAVGIPAPTPLDRVPPAFRRLVDALTARCVVEPRTENWEALRLAIAACAEHLRATP